MLTNFKKLTKVEKELMDKQRQRTNQEYSNAHYGKLTVPEYETLRKSLYVSYQISDPFTVCIVKSGTKQVAGVAKRVRYAPMEDKFSEEKARDISFSSAIRTFLEEV